MRPYLAGLFLPRRPLIVDNRGFSVEFQGATNTEIAFTQGTTDVTLGGVPATLLLATNPIAFPFSGKQRVRLELCIPRLNLSVGGNVSFNFYYRPISGAAVDLGYCRLIGMHTLDFPLYSTICITPPVGMIELFVTYSKAGGTVIAQGAISPYYFRVSAL